MKNVIKKIFLNKYIARRAGVIGNMIPVVSTGFLGQKIDDHESSFPVSPPFLIIVSVISRVRPATLVAADILVSNTD